MDIFLTIWLLIGLVILWLNALATLAIRYDHCLDKTQRIGQLCVVWLIPVLGASFVLHLVYEHSPDAIPQSWIPWPLKNLIFGKPIPHNKNRGGYEADSYSGSGNNRSHDSGGNDGGGGSD